jgi:uncharacterized membrane protein YbhN (UPF0104 family)
MVDDEEEAGRTPALPVGGLVGRASEARHAPPRGLAYALAAVMFVATAALGFAELPARTDDLRPLLLLVVAVLLGPATSALNAAEYAVTARYTGLRVGRIDAVRVAVLSTAANMLPVPGAVLVRAAALQRAGTSYLAGGRVIVAVSGAWLGATALLTGIVMFAAGEHEPFGTILLVAGVAGLFGAHRLAGGRRKHGGTRLAAALVLVEAATVAIGALRLWLCMRGLGYDVTVVQGTALTFASVLASAVAVFPGGLGLREALAAAIGPLVALPAAVAAVAAAVDRLLGLPVVFLVAAGFAVKANRDKGHSAEPRPPIRT